MRIGTRASVAHSMVPRSSGRRRTLGDPLLPLMRATRERRRASRNPEHAGTTCDNDAQESAKDEQKCHFALNAAEWPVWSTFLWPARQSARSATAKRMHANRMHADLMHARNKPRESRPTSAALPPAGPVRLRETLDGAVRGKSEGKARIAWVQPHETLPQAP